MRRVGLCRTATQLSVDAAWSLRGLPAKPLPCQRRQWAGQANRHKLTIGGTRAMRRYGDIRRSAPIGVIVVLLLATVTGWSQQPPPPWIKWLSEVDVRLGHSSTNITGVSSGGTLIGSYYYHPYYYHAFRWIPNPTPPGTPFSSGSFRDLGDLGGGYSVAYGMSSDGRIVVGAAYTAQGRWRAFRWRETDNTMIDLGNVRRHSWLCL
jgi:probable HAF family extracellular repeat protein